jgi:hypothetical protein
MNYCKTLKFEEKPDYNFLRRMFRDLFERIGFELDFQYDWTEFEESIEYETHKIQLEILKKGEDIPAGELVEANNKSVAPKMEFDDCVEVEDIELDMGSGQENVPEDLLEVSDTNFLKNFTSDKKEFLASKKKDIIWE